MRGSVTYNGSRFWVSGKNEIEVEVKKALRLDDLEKNTQIVDKNTTVKSWSDKWLSEYIKGYCGDATYSNYVTNLNKHIIPEIGSMKISQVREFHLVKILNNLTGHSKSHITKVRQLLKRMFEDAKTNKMIRENPAEKLKLPACTDGTGRSITDKERKYILQVAEYHKNGLWVKLMLYCGLRPGETAALCWRHIDLKKKVLHIEQSRKAKTGEIGDPKSAAGKRKIPIPNKLLTELEKASKGKSKFDFVFVQETTGQRHTLRSMNQMWHSFKRELNIAMGCNVVRNELKKPFPVADDLIPYCLRHTFCTDLQTAKVPINVAKELMGHEEIETTAHIYTDFSEDSFNDAADCINAFHDGSKVRRRAVGRAVRLRTVEK